MAKITTTKPTTAAKRPATAATHKTIAAKEPTSPSAAVSATMSSTATSAKPAQRDDEDLMRKPDLIEKVVARSGIKKKDAKPVVEAMLAVLAETLAEGREMRLPPLGKVIINRTKELDNGTAYIVKIRHSNKAGVSSVTPAKDPLANAAG